MKHLDITVRGRVQGVFFRDTARRHAKKLGIAGFARNEPDGSVYIEAEGDEEKLREFTEWCCEGSPFAHVEDVEIKEGDMKHFREFKVEHG